MRCHHKPDRKTCLNRIPLCKKCKARIIPRKNYKYIVMKVFEYCGIIGVALAGSDIRHFHNVLCTALNWSDSVYGNIFIGVLLCLVYAAAMFSIEVLFRTRYLDYQTIQS